MCEVVARGCCGGRGTTSMKTRSSCSGVSFRGEDESDGLPVEDPILDTAIAVVDRVAARR